MHSLREAGHGGRRQGKGGGSKGHRTEVLGGVYGIEGDSYVSPFIKSRRKRQSAFVRSIQLEEKYRKIASYEKCERQHFTPEQRRIAWLKKRHEKVRLERKYGIRLH